MQYRSFGGGVRVSALGIGCGRVGSLNNPVPLREIEATLEAAVEAGVCLFDTADIYGQGDSERTLRRLVARHPGRIFVVTKVGFTHGRLAGALRFAKPLLRAVMRSRPATRGAAVQLRGRMMNQDFSAQYLRRAVDGSRHRLGVDCLDGLLLHDPPHEVLVSQEIHELLDGLVREQKVSHVGVSATSVDEVEAAVSIPAVTMLQVSLSVARALSGTAVLDRLRERDIALFVREILRKPEDGQRRENSPGEALAAAFRLQFATAAIVGVSTRAHLKNFLPVVS